MQLFNDLTTLPPVKAGCVRLFHGTYRANLSSIEQFGLLTGKDLVKTLGSKARNAKETSTFVWATNKPTTIFGNTSLIIDVPESIIMGTQGTTVKLSRSLKPNEIVGEIPHARILALRDKPVTQTKQEPTASTAMLEAVGHLPIKKIYRVEDSAGLGPFHANFWQTLSSKDPELLKKWQANQRNFPGFKTEFNNPDVDYISGIESPSLISKWFGDFIEELDSAGYYVAEYESRDYIPSISGTQTAFSRKNSKRTNRVKIKNFMVGR